MAHTLLEIFKCLNDYCILQGIDSIDFFLFMTQNL